MRGNCFIMSDAPSTRLTQVKALHSHFFPPSPQWSDQLEQNETSARMLSTMFESRAPTVENHLSLKVSRSTRLPVDRSRTVRKKLRSVTTILKDRCAIESVPTDIYYTHLIGSTARLHIGNSHKQCPMNIDGDSGSHAGPSRNVAAVEEHLCSVNTDGGGLFIFSQSRS